MNKNSCNNFCEYKSLNLVLFVPTILMAFAFNYSLYFYHRYDFNTASEQIMGLHEKPIKCVEFCAALGESTRDNVYNIFCLCIKKDTVQYRP